MDRHALKDLIYGGMEELTQNSKYYYNSSVGTQYNHWTDQGKENLIGFIDMMASEIIKCRIAEDEQRSKDMVMKGLKS